MLKVDTAQKKSYRCPVEITIIHSSHPLTVVDLRPRSTT